MVKYQLSLRPRVNIFPRDVMQLQLHFIEADSTPRLITTDHINKNGGEWTEQAPRVSLETISRQGLTASSLIKR